MARRRRTAGAVGVRRAARPLDGRRAVLRARRRGWRSTCAAAATSTVGDLVLVRPVAPQRPRRARGRALARPPGRRARRGRGAAARPRLRPRLPASGRGGGRGGRRSPGRRRAAARPDRRCRRSRSTRRARGTSTTRSRPSATATACALCVHIADVAAFVRPGSATRRRGRAARQQRLRARARSSRCCRTRSRAMRAASCPAMPRGTVTVEMLDRRRRHGRARRPSTAA